MMKSRWFVAIAVLVLFTNIAVAADNAANTAAKRYGAWGVDLSGMDPSVKPGDDFFRYVNGHWLANTQIPADRTSFGSGAILGELSQARVRAIVEGWAADKNLK